MINQIYSNDKSLQINELWGGVNLFTRKAKNIMMFFAIMLTILVTLPEEGKAQCPSGWTGKTITTTYTSPSGSICNIVVTYCFAWSGMPHNVYYIKDINIYIDAACPLVTTFSYSHLMDFVKDYIYKVDLMVVWPPCTESPVETIEYSESSCIKYINDPNNPLYFSGGHLQIAPCDNTGLCQTKYSVCWDYSVNPAVLTKTFLNQNTSGVNCSLTIPQNWIPAGKTMFDYFETACYLMNCQ